MQERILKKCFWNVGHSLFRAYPWSVNGNFDEVIKKSMLNWVKIKNLHAKLKILALYISYFETPWVEFANRRV